MIEKEVQAHSSVLHDCTLGALEGSNPKPYSFACELSPLSYLWYYSPSNLYAYIDHSIRYTKGTLISWYTAGALLRGTTVIE